MLFIQIFEVTRFSVDLLPQAKFACEASPIHCMCRFVRGFRFSCCCRGVFVCSVCRWKICRWVSFYCQGFSLIEFDLQWSTSHPSIFLINNTIIITTITTIFTIIIITTITTTHSRSAPLVWAFLLVQTAETSSCDPHPKP